MENRNDIAMRTLNEYFNIAVLISLIDFVVPLIDRKEKENRSQKHDIITYFTSVLLILTVSPSPPTSSITPFPSTSLPPL